MVEERLGSATTADKQYVYHPHYVDAIAMRRDGGGNQHYFLQDANFNVTAVTDWSGTVVERYNYTPYGEVTILNGASDGDGNEWTEDTNGSDIDNELLYTGRRRDPETGLQLNRNRFYAAHLGRWLSRDPIGYLAGDMNLYGYVGGMPTRYVDSTGLIVQDRGHDWGDIEWDDYWEYFWPWDDDDFELDEDLLNICGSEVGGNDAQKIAIVIGGSAAAGAVACRCLPIVAKAIGGGGDSGPKTPKPPFGGSGPDPNNPVIIRYPPPGHPIQRPGIGPPVDQPWWPPMDGPQPPFPGPGDPPFGVN